MNFPFVLSLVLAGSAVVSVFIWIPLISEYAFWFAVAAYVILAGSRGYHFSFPRLESSAGGGRRFERPCARKS